jgi:ABC-2 type transport system permease protein
MSTAAVTAGAATRGPDHASVTAQIVALSRRSILNSFRQPAQWIPSFAFPLLFCAVNTAALSKVIRNVGVSGYLNFALATVIIQSILFGAANAGTDLANDIQAGFLDRLVSSPVSRPAIIVGRLASAFVLGLLQGTVVFGVLSLFGARVKGGVGGTVVLVLAAGLFGLGIGALTCAVAVKTGSAEAVQGFTPILTALIFFSSAYFPKEGMSGWFKAVVTANPINKLIEELRSLVLVGFDAGKAATALAIPLGLAIVGVAIASRSMSRRFAGAA